MYHCDANLKIFMICWCPGSPRRAPFLIQNVSFLRSGIWSARGAKSNPFLGEGGAKARASGEGHIFILRFYRRSYMRRNVKRVSQASLPLKLKGGGVSNCLRPARHRALPGLPKAPLWVPWIFVCSHLGHLGYKGTVQDFFSTFLRG